MKYLLFFLSLPILAQQPNPIMIFANDPAGSCPSRRMAVSVASGGLFYCAANNSMWSAVSGSAGAFGGSTAIGKGNLGATPSFDLSASANKSPVVFTGTVNAAITSISFTNKSKGASFFIKFIQDNVGHAVNFNGSVTGPCPISTTANKYSLQQYLILDDGTTVQGGVCVSDDPQAIPTSQGGTGLTTATDDTVAVYNGTGADQKVLPNCTDTGGNHLNYTQSTNAFSCGTSGAGGGGGVRSVTIPISGYNGAAFGIYWSGCTLTSGTFTGGNTAMGFLGFPQAAASGTPTLHCQWVLPPDYSSGLQLGLMTLDNGNNGGTVQIDWGTKCWPSGTAPVETMANTASGTGTYAAGGDMLTIGPTSIGTTGCATGDLMVIEIARNNTVGGNDAGPVAYVALQIKYTSTY